MLQTLTRIACVAFVVMLSRTTSAECVAPFVTLDSINVPDRARIARELRADLRERAIDVCEDEKAGEPVARISIAPTEGGVSIRLEVRDAITSKEVARTIDTSKIPSDGRALAIALAVAELLRASWVELAMHDAPPPPVPVPPPVQRVAEAALSPPPVAPRPFSIGFAFASEVFSSGFVRFGGDVHAGIDVGRFAFDLAGGFRKAPSRSGPDGSVDADALVFSIAAMYALVPRERVWGIDPLVRVAVVPVSFHPTAKNGAMSAAGTLVGLEASGGVRGHLSISRNLLLVLDVAGGATLRSADAKDGDVTVATTSGALFAWSLGLGGKF